MVIVTLNKHQPPVKTDFSALHPIGPVITHNTVHWTLLLWLWQPFSCHFSILHWHWLAGPGPALVCSRLNLFSVRSATDCNIKFRKLFLQIKRQGWQTELYLDCIWCVSKSSIWAERNMGLVCNLHELLTTIQDVQSSPSLSAKL